MDADQLPLFPKDGASDLARALLDTAWMVVQSRTYLSTATVAELYTCLAYFRERLVTLTYSAKVLREVTASPRFGLRPAIPLPPVSARLVG